MIHQRRSRRSRAGIRARKPLRDSRPRRCRTRAIRASRSRARTSTPNPSCPKLLHRCALIACCSPVLAHRVSTLSLRSAVVQENLSRDSGAPAVSTGTLPSTVKPASGGNVAGAPGGPVVASSPASASGGAADADDRSAAAGSRRNSRAPSDADMDHPPASSLSAADNEEVWRLRDCAASTRELTE